MQTRYDEWRTSMLLLRFCQIFVAFVYDVKYYTNTCIHSSFMFIYENLNTGLMVHRWNLDEFGLKENEATPPNTSLFIFFPIFSYFACGRWRDSFWWYHLWKQPSCRLCFSICDRSGFCNLSLLTKPVPLRSCQLSVTLPVWFGMESLQGQGKNHRKHSDR